MNLNYTISIKSNLKLKMINLKFILLIIIVLTNFLNFNVSAAVHDSIGVEKKDGKFFVLHEVDAKETLFSIAKRYNAKLDDIRMANPDMGDGIKIGQNLRIPYKGTVPGKL